MFPFIHWAKSKYRREENAPQKGENLTAPYSKHPQLVWKYCALFLHNDNWICQSLRLLLITFISVYFDGFLFILFFGSKSQIWFHLETVHNLMLSMTLPIRSNYSCQGSTEKKCQLAIKVPQTSIMSSSYDSLGAAQNWAIMSTVKNGCGRPQPSLFPLIIAQHRHWNHCMCMLEPSQLQVCMLKITPAPNTFMGWRCGTKSLYVHATRPS